MDYRKGKVLSMSSWEFAISNDLVKDPCAEVTEKICITWGGGGVCVHFSFLFSGEKDFVSAKALMLRRNEVQMPLHAVAPWFPECARKQGTRSSVRAALVCRGSPEQVPSRLLPSAAGCWMLQCWFGLVPSAPRRESFSFPTKSGAIYKVVTFRAALTWQKTAFRIRG